MTNKGRVKSIKDYIVEVEFLAAPKPQVNTILAAEHDSQIKLMGIKWASPTILVCLALFGQNDLFRGAAVIDTQKPLTTPVGPSVLGRAFDIFGKGKDGLDDISRVMEKPIFGPSAKLWEVKATQEVLETGIKALDLFCPLVKGGKT
ncbi:hypothetical protein KJ605_00975, partial [Patescibacteria group bacterium]|nr:hypothetical protein [Patescibacteria group bacterium]